MDNMVSKVKNVKNENKDKYRELIKILISFSPEIKNLEIHQDISGELNGLISFEINTFEAGISTGVFYKYKKYLFSQFIIRFLVNLIIRENLDDFSELIRSFDFEMIQLIEDTRIINCGMKINNEVTTFTFHLTQLLDLIKENPVL
jgi:hypothetical protein